MSADLEALSNQPGSEDKTWKCCRCTFLNSPEHGICVMCASSRGVNLVDQTEVGSRVCGNCTFHNKEDTKVCVQCGKTLDLTGPPEAYIKTIFSCTQRSNCRVFCNSGGMCCFVLLKETQTANLDLNV